MHFLIMKKNNLKSKLNKIMTKNLKEEKNVLFSIFFFFWLNAIVYKSNQKFLLLQDFKEDLYENVLQQNMKTS